MAPLSSGDRSFGVLRRDFQLGVELGKEYFCTSSFVGWGFDGVLDA
jgi:hypothetical protein